MSDFVKLLRDLLLRADLRNETIDKILSTPKYMDMFHAAFTHKSYDENAKRNYEVYEQLGDLVLNMAIVNYVTYKFPTIQSADWLSNIKHRLISGKNFARLASDIGFYPHIKMGAEKIQDIQDGIDKTRKFLKETTGTSFTEVDEFIDEVKEYRSVLEDVFEAFAGTLQRVVNDYSGLEAGPGYAIAYKFMKSFLDQIEIPTKAEKVFDPITIVKEIYDRQKWPNKTNEMTLTRKDEESGIHTVTYITVMRGGRVRFGEGKSFDKTEARRKAAIETLKILKEKYGIVSQKAEVL